MKDMNNVKITFLSALAWKYESFKKVIVAKLGRENKKRFVHEFIKKTNVVK